VRVPRPTRPVGTVTRGTTAPNRLRRVDRWLLGTHEALLRSAPAGPLAVDLGYGAYPVTTVEMFERLRAVRPDLRVVGLEIEPGRVAAAAAYQRVGLDFRLGGFELPVDEPPLLIRAFNVLRQYDESRVPAAWLGLASRLAPKGLLVEGTCSENGRIAVWVTLRAGGPRTLTFAGHLGSLASPAIFAERLPKALIHRNRPGERIHAFLADWELAWRSAAALSVFGVRQRWIGVAREMARCWPLIGGENRWRLGELTLDWSAVAPGSSGGRPFS
jgi:hypothetical protein